MAITGIFVPSAGLLTLLGDGVANTLTLSRDAAGTILANGGAIKILGGAPTVANTKLISIFGLGGDDVLTLDESNGALPRATMFGGSGNDTVTAGSGSDQLFGQSGNDTLFGRGGNDLLFGGAGDDVLVGGDGNDQMFGGAGNDRMIWNPGDDSDLMEGGAGIDTADVNGGNGAEGFTVAANGTRVRVDRVAPAPFALDIGTTETLVVNMNGGDDTFSATGNLAALITLTVDGGAGNDTIRGSNGADLLLGGDGDDVIDGQQGNDTAFLGGGDDVFQWDPGDGSDVVEGEAGSDTMLFNGSGGAEVFEASADGGRVTFTRNLGNIVMDTDGVENFTINALGGVDTIIINDAAGTDLQQITINLAATISGAAGDGAADAVIVNATNAADAIEVFGSGNDLGVSGGASFISVNDAEGANDALVIHGLGGDDFLSATTLAAGIITLTIDGGAGDDVIIGSQAGDMLLGGQGDDFVAGEGGNDVALLGEGDDVFEWNPGDGNDTVEGEGGFDILRFFGSNASETVNILANGGRALFLRDVANVTMDLDDVERVEFSARGGADTIIVGDLTGTDVTDVEIALNGFASGGDGAADTVTVNAAAGEDVVTVTGGAGAITVSGLHATVDIDDMDAGLDRLVLNGQGGDDVIDASGLAADAIALTMNGGLGNDVFLGSAGDDLINGGDGADIALMGEGGDTFVWNPGDDNDTLEGQGGFDTMLFNGANIAEVIDLSADGGRAGFFRNIANVTMDLNDVEQVTFNALGGADSITVNDLSGTDVSEVLINLAAAGGGGDGQADVVTVQGTNGDDAVLVVSDGADVLVLGLSATVRIRGFEAALDRLVINGLGGDDVIEASGLLAGGLLLTANGGEGDDVLIGGEGADTLLGGNGDDVLIGGLGLDILDGGAGDNILIQ
jgi:Ca2+-binding RTX toxin-like protein